MIAGSCAPHVVAALDRAPAGNVPPSGILLDSECVPLVGALPWLPLSTAYLLLPHSSAFSRTPLVLQLQVLDRRCACGVSTIDEILGAPSLCPLCSSTSASAASSHLESAFSIVAHVMLATTALPTWSPTPPPSSGHVAAAVHPPRDCFCGFCSSPASAPYPHPPPSVPSMSASSSSSSYRPLPLASPLPLPLAVLCRMRTLLDSFC
jgi:hypothetical protein